jgi:hypothetical protein
MKGSSGIKRIKVFIPPIPLEGELRSIRLPAFIIHQSIKSNGIFLLTNILSKELFEKNKVSTSQVPPSGG